MISFRLRTKWQNCRGYVPRYERTPKNEWFDIHSVFATHVETVVLLSHKKPDDHICVKMEYVDNREIQPDRVTYKLIQEYIEEKYGFKVHTAYIAEVKRSLGLPTYPAPNAVEQRKHYYYSVPDYKAEAIKDALKHFNLI